MNEKSANAISSMLHHSFDREITPMHPDGFFRGLRLHADNCSGRNKNRYVLWYLCWRIIMGFHESVGLDFMVLGHTKKVFDSAFRHMKRKL